MASALALALASGGRKVLLLEVEGRQGLAQVFDTPPLEYGEQRIANAPDGGSVYALSIEPEAAMLEYLEMFYNIKRGGVVLKRIGAVDFATTIAPGLRDVLLTGKAGESVRSKEQGKFRFDAVVLDAPPTGRIARFLTANGEAANLARVGPIKNQAEMVMKVFRSSQTAVHLVTLLEEMPVQETAEGIDELIANRLPVGAIIVNMSRPPLLPEHDEKVLTEITDAQLGAALNRAGLAKKATTIAGLRAELADHHTRVAMEATERAKLQELNRPLLELPWLAEGVDVAALYGMAELLAEQGVVPR